MSRVTHNAAHVFTQGLSAGSGAIPKVVPIFHPVQVGWKVVYEDFHGKTSIAADSSLYEFTAIGTGTTAVSTGGVLFDNGADADNAGAELQAIDATIIPSGSTKKFWLEARMTVTAATMASQEIFVGLTSDQQTTNFAAADGLSWAFDDGFGIGKLDAETTLSFIARQSDTEQTVSFGSNPTSGTDTTWSIYYDGAAYNLYKDGVLRATEVKSVFNNDAAMGVAVHYKAGAAETQNLLLNYILFAYEI